ncbi:MAG: hypothetical protein HQL55_16620 [Magnetococcales bacterium]|nr:hypothetical protein [Magnetococcales bacterium]
MNTRHKSLAKAGAHPMLYDAKTEAIETRRVKVRKLMARGITVAQMAPMLGVDAEVVYKDIASIRAYIAKELQGSDLLALVAESLGVLSEVRASALKDMDKADTPLERSIARRDIVRVETERMKCILLACGGVGSGGRGMINVTPTMEGDPVPLLEDQHQKVIDVAKQLLDEVFQVGGGSPQATQQMEQCEEEGA